MKKPDINTIRDLSTPTVEQLIDVLIEARYYMKVCRSNFKDEGLEESVKYTDKELEIIDRALKKAGCDL